MPCLSDVPYISAEFPPSSVEKHLLESIEKEGKVIGRAPVQITDIEELPGSLLVKWSEVLLFFLFLWILFICVIACPDLK